MTLDRLKIGEEAMIVEIVAKQALKQRLWDLGFIQDAHIQCVLESPGKDPKAYFIKGTQIAIRNEDAKEIIIRRKQDGED